MIQNFFQLQYDFEIEQKRNLDGLINIPIVALTVLGGAMSTLLVRFDYMSSMVMSVLFLISMVSGSMGVCKAFYFATTSFIGFRYQKLASAPMLIQHYDSLYDWHLRNGSTDAKLRAQEDFDSFLCLRLSEASEHNGALNILRGERMHEATKSIAFSFAMLLLATPFFLVLQIMNSDEPQRIEIVAPIPS